MLIKISKRIFRVEELNHCNPGRHINRVHVITVNQWIKRFTDDVQVLFVWLNVLQSGRLLIEKYFKIFNRLWATT